MLPHHGWPVWHKLSDKSFSEWALPLSVAATHERCQGCAHALPASLSRFGYIPTSHTCAGPFCACSLEPWTSWRQTPRKLLRFSWVLAVSVRWQLPLVTCPSVSSERTATMWPTPWHMPLGWLPPLWWGWASPWWGAPRRPPGWPLGFTRFVIDTHWPMLSGRLTQVWGTLFPLSTVVWSPDVLPEFLTHIKRTVTFNVFHSSRQSWCTYSCCAQAKTLNYLLVNEVFNSTPLSLNVPITRQCYQDIKWILSDIFSFCPFTLLHFLIHIERMHMFSVRKVSSPCAIHTIIIILVNKTNLGSLLELCNHDASKFCHFGVKCHLLVSKLILFLVVYHLHLF